MARETYIAKKRPDGSVDVIPKEDVAEWTARWWPSKKLSSMHFKKPERGSWVWRDGKLVQKSAQIIQLKGRGLQVIKDIEPYKAVCVDGRVVGGRRQHREMLRNNNLVEVGDQAKTTPKPVCGPNKVDIKLVETIKRAMGKL